MTVPESEQAAWLTLTLAPGLSDSALRGLLRKFGSPEAVLAQPASTLSGLLDRSVADALKADPTRERVEAAIRWLAQPDNHLVTLADSDYPRLLLECGDPPSVLYLKGRRELLGAQCFAVVGSRNPTPQGAANAEAFARTLSDAGLTITSGLALGIDAAAHAGGLAGAASSIAVVGTGLDIVYPARNRALAHRLAEQGALLSEFPLGTPGRAGNFPQRNRIISGLSLGCLVVEAALASGSLITARLAGEQGRDVFAIPGSIHSPLSKGCHQLIKQGAKLVDSAADILVEVGRAPEGARVPSSGQRGKKRAGAAQDDPLLAAIGHDPVTLDTIVARSGLPPETVQARLLSLELDGVIAPLPGGKFQQMN